MYCYYYVVIFIGGIFVQSNNSKQPKSFPHALLYISVLFNYNAEFRIKKKKGKRGRPSSDYKHNQLPISSYDPGLLPLISVASNNMGWVHSVASAWEEFMVHPHSCLFYNGRHPQSGSHVLLLSLPAITPSNLFSELLLFDHTEFSFKLSESDSELTGGLVFLSSLTQKHCFFYQV